MLESLPPWVVMWLLATAIYAGCKGLTWLRGPTAPLAWQLAYLVAWPGMDSTAFLTKASRPPSLKEWLFAAAKLSLGILILWIGLPLLETPLLRGWLGMAGLIFILHFGSFHLLSCFWRSRGFDAKPLMNWPVLATSLSDFWSRRWNTAFRDLTHRFLFKPLTARLGPRGSLGVGFLASGLVHDAVISLPAGGGFGGPTLYFVLQGLGLLVERSKPGRKLRGRLFTLLVVLGPATILFHPPFITRVVLPFLDAIGT